jgi:hypothetical protein
MTVTGQSFLPYCDVFAFLTLQLRLQTQKYYTIDPPTYEKRVEFFGNISLPANRPGNDELLYLQNLLIPKADEIFFFYTEYK